MAKATRAADLEAINPVIFRAYDIRGVVGETLGAAEACAIGRAYASYIRNMQEGEDKPCVAVGFDGRESSPMLEQALIEGIASAGVEVVRIGLGPTPMLYFSVFHLDLDGGVMVTGSHNPPSHNGFKMMAGKKALFGEEIQALRQRIEHENYALRQGNVEEAAVKQAYIETLLSAYTSDNAKLKVAWDAGNGAAGEVMAELCRRLPGEHIPLYAEINSAFPNHHPDPTVPENLQDLIAAVQQQGCDFGVAFDGDGDRIGVVDGKGAIIWGDQLMAIYARDVLA